jgi:predicted transcriptional regulator
MMDVEIGMAAGEVYRFLEANGAASVSQMKKAMGRKVAELHQAVGWLAREGKVERQPHGRTVLWSIG